MRTEEDWCRVVGRLRMEEERTGQGWSRRIEQLSSWALRRGSVLRPAGLHSARKPTKEIRIDSTIQGVSDKAHGGTGRARAREMIKHGNYSVIGCTMAYLMHWAQN